MRSRAGQLPSVPAARPACTHNATTAITTQRRQELCFTRSVCSYLSIPDSARTPWPRHAATSGCNRIVDRLDYDLIRRRPKFFGGFSDLTSLVNAIHARTGLVTFHSPVASSEWNDFSVQSFRAVAMNAEAAVLRNPVVRPADDLVAREERISTVRAGRAHGRLVGGNLTVLASLAGTPYFPDCRGAILFLEDINEYIYRIDRCLSTLRLAGALSQLAGVVLGRFTKCEPGDGYGSLTLDEVFDDYFLPLNVPVFRGAAIGHIRRKLTVPVGALAEMDADTGTIRLSAPAVS